MTCPRSRRACSPGEVPCLALEPLGLGHGAEPPMGLGRSSGAPPSSEKKRSLGSAHWHVTWQSARWRAIARSPFVPRRRSGGAPAAAPDLLRHVGAGCLPLHAAPSAPCGQAGAARHGGTPTPGRTPLETRSPCRVAAPCASPVRACPPATRPWGRDSGGWLVRSCDHEGGVFGPSRAGSRKFLNGQPPCAYFELGQYAQRACTAVQEGLGPS